MSDRRSDGGRGPAGDGGSGSAPEIAIVYAPHCPNVALARQRLRSALAAMELPPRWEEWSTESPDTPAFARGYGSPTVLVNGRDAAGGEVGDGEPGGEEETTAADRCRIYPATEGPIERAPSLEAILDALVAARGGGKREGRHG